MVFVEKNDEKLQRLGMQSTHATKLLPISLLSPVSQFSTAFLNPVFL